MSIYNRKHWHALSHSLRPTRRDWRPTRPTQRVSQVPDSVCLGLVPGQIDSPYLIIIPWITIPRDEYYTIFSGKWGSPRGGPWSLPKLPYVPMFPHVFLSCSPLNKFAYHLLPPSISSRKNKTKNKTSICVTSSQAFERKSLKKLPLRAQPPRKGHYREYPTREIFIIWKESFTFIL